MKNRYYILMAWAVIQLLALLYAPAAASAADGHGKRGPRFSANMKKWQSLSEEERQAIRDRAKKITPEQLKELRKKLAEFKKLPNDNQKQIRNNSRRFRDLPPVAKRKIAKRFKRFRMLPEEKRMKLRRKFRQRRRSGSAGRRPGPGPIRHMRPDARPEDKPDSGRERPAVAKPRLPKTPRENGPRPGVKRTKPKRPKGVRPRIPKTARGDTPKRDPKVKRPGAKKPPRRDKPKSDPKERIKKLGERFKGMDRDGDGSISKREFAGLPERFESFDTNGDGKISKNEWAVAVRKLKLNRRTQENGGRPERPKGARPERPKGTKPNGNRPRMRPKSRRGR